MNQQLQEIMEVIAEIKDDQTVPRNVKAKLDTCLTILKNESEELSIRVDKVLQELDDVANDNNTQSYARSQIWNIVSMLESISN